MRRLLIGMATLILLLETGAGIAAAATPILTIQPQSGTAGTTVTFSGSGFTPSGRVSVLLIEGLGLIVSEQRAGPDGTISGNFIMPEPGNAPELIYGEVAVFAIDEDSSQESTRAYFEITKTPLLPDAGGTSNLLMSAIAGLVLIILGTTNRLKPAQG